MNRYLYILALGLLFCACSDFLEPQSQSEYVPKTATALNEMLLGEAYLSTSAADKGIMMYHSVFDDDMVCAEIPTALSPSDESKMPGRLAFFSWQPDCFTRMAESGMYKSIWENCYILIRGANAALDYIDAVSGTDDEKADVMAQAYALRAFYYFHLVNLWGEPYTENPRALGVPLKLSSKIGEMILPRDEVKKVYEQILSDLDKAEKYYRGLPAGQQFRPDYRTSLPMVELLKSRVYLYMGNWPEAARYAGMVIGDWNFSLFNLNDVVTSAQAPYYNFITFDNPESIWMFGHITSLTTFPVQTMTCPDPTKPGKTLQRLMFNASPGLLAGFEEGDLRKRHYVVQEFGYPGVYTAIGKVNIRNTSHLPEPLPTTMGCAFRLSEAYLNLAEAAAMHGDEETALGRLNDLREKRFLPGDYVPVEGLTGQALVDRIRTERRLEFCFEGHRWFDLRRYGMPSFSRTWCEKGEPVNTYVLEEKDPFYALPLPETVLKQNMGLVQNKLGNPR